MTTPEVSFTVEDAAVEALYHRVDVAISEGSLAAFLRGEAVPYLQRQANERFAQEGPGWKPLARSTIEDRLRQNFPGEHPILQRTKALKDYVTRSPGVITPLVDGVELETPNPTSDAELLGKFMQAQHGDSVTPPRPVIGLEERDAVALTELLHIDIAVKIMGGM